MGKSMFCGVGCALATPFADGRIDEKAFIRLIDYQLTGGIDALIVCGTTGEASTLTDGEIRERSHLSKAYLSILR